MVDKNAASCSTDDLIVIGGGVVGLTCLRVATLKGWNTGVDEAAGTLERALIRDSISEFRPYSAHNIPLCSCRSLVCLFRWDIPSRSADADCSDASVQSNEDRVTLLDHVLKESQIVGDYDAKLYATGREIPQEKRKNCPRVYLVLFTFLVR